MKKAALILCHLCLLLIAHAVYAKGKATLPNVYTRIIQLEDARSLGNGELEALLQHKLPEVRYRAALAIGRIGDKRGTDALLQALEKESLTRLRLMTVFALGEMEDAKAAQALLKVLERKTEAREVRARTAEALSKIVISQDNAQALGREFVEQINSALIAQLPASNAVLSPGNKLLASLTITALMRLRLPSCLEPLINQLKSGDAEIRAEAANALFRSRLPTKTAVPALIELLTDPAINVRANSARALGAGKDTSAFEPLTKLLNDSSDQVQVSAVRGLTMLGDRRAVAPLLAFGEKLSRQYAQVKASGVTRPPQINLLLELATALGSFKDQSAVPFLQQLRTATGLGEYIEIETALASFGDQAFWQGIDDQAFVRSDWRKTATLVQALGELGSVRSKAELQKILEQAEQKRLDARVMPALIGALGRVKFDGLPALARRQLASTDLQTRALSAGLLTEHSEENFNALTRALEQAKSDRENDAKLSLISAIAEYKTPRAIEVIKSSLNDSDPLVRRRAAELLNLLGETVPTQSTEPPHNSAYYARVSRLMNKRVLVTMHTSKGVIKVEMFAKDAPMTVDNFIELARKKYFDGITFHRVVSNFVVQGGDPQGTGDGGPGYQIRCEINTKAYQRGSMGMALSGKDTGGSQFFFCHSPQPHLDGGYTVFGQVIVGMETVDKLTRGDVITRVAVTIH